MSHDVTAAPPSEKPVWEWMKKGIALAVGIFILYTGIFGSLESIMQRSLFAAAVSTLAVFLFPLWRGTSLRHIGIIIDIAIVGIMAGAAVYVFHNFEYIMEGLPEADTMSMILGYGALLAILELARRATNIVFSLVVTLSLLYVFFGDLIPGSFGHRGFSVGYVNEILFLSDRGIYGLLVNIASTTLAVFVLFGGFLLHTGAGSAFFNLSARAGGSSPGGAAKIATIASGLFGSINGSSVANVATTGNFTIPLMKRLKYPPAFAGAVEAVASTGGQLMPPIMGTAAFVMAELININYWSIALAAGLPALLFYTGLFLTIHFIAKEKKLGTVKDDDLPDWRSALNVEHLSPIIAAIAGIIFGILRGKSISLTACYGIIAIIITYTTVSLIYRRSILSILNNLINALIEGGRGLVVVGIMLIAAQIFVSMINLSGLGVNLTSAILKVAEGRLVLTAVIMAVVCLIAGMGLPTSAAYVLVAAVFAPVMIMQGMDPLTVHLFVLYYAALSVITPPVCVAVFVSSALAKAPWLSVAGYAVRLGTSAYFIPFLILLFPGLLLKGSAVDIVFALHSGIIFTVCASFLSSRRRLISMKGRIPDYLLWLLPLSLVFLGNLGINIVITVLLIVYNFVWVPFMGKKNVVHG